MASRGYGVQREHANLVEVNEAKMDHVKLLINMYDLVLFNCCVCALGMR
jgi:hypothetical protein